MSGAPTKFLCALCGASTDRAEFIGGVPFCFRGAIPSCYSEVAVRREVTAHGRRADPGGSSTEGER